MGYRVSIDADRTVDPAKRFKMTKNAEQRKLVMIAGLCVLIVSMVFPLWVATAAAVDRETPVVIAVRRVSPAVVNISSEITERRQVSPFSGFGANPLFDHFFRDFFDPHYEERFQRSSLGSGVIIDGKRGFILTNAHVIEQAGTITVTLKDEREYTAQVVGADPDSDLAVLKIKADDPLPSVAMGNSDDLMIGETVIAIGNPFGFSHTVTTGVVSAVNRSIRTDSQTYHDFIQIDASINPGNSGGPLLNINGELIGINTAIYAKAQGIGFAIPINTARRIVTDLIEYGEVIPAWVGIAVQDMDEGLAHYLNMPRGKGVVITGVTAGGPAAAAGIRNGDVLLSVDQRKIGTTEDYDRIINGVGAGDTISLTLLRDNKPVTARVTTRVFPMEKALALAETKLGIRVEPITPANRRAYRILTDSGVMIRDVYEQSYLAHIGVQTGDVIRQIDDFTIRGIEDFKKAIVKYRKKRSLVILIQRGRQGYYVTVKP